MDSPPPQAGASRSPLPAMPMTALPRLPTRHELDSCLISSGMSPDQIHEAYVDAEEKQWALEEELFGRPPDRDASAPTFVEKPFGRAFAPDELSYQPFNDTTDSLSSIVVSIALFDGDKMLFACSGIPVTEGSNQAHLTRVVTSAYLVTVYNANINRDDKLRIEVRSEEGTCLGLLGLYDDCIAIVTVKGCPIVHLVKGDLEALTLQPACHGERVIAAGCAFKSGMYMAIHGSVSLEDRCKWVSCTGDVITAAALGGPLIGLDGRFLGMNIYDDDNHPEANAAYSFISRVDLCERLKHFRILNRKKPDFRRYVLPSGVACVFPSGYRRSIYRLKSLGYPMPPPLVLELKGELHNTFEDTFGEFYAWEEYYLGTNPNGPLGQSIWELLEEKVISDISRRVVLLKSFDGFLRYFVCTGLFIKWHGSMGIRSAILTSASLVRRRKEDAKEDTIDTSLKIEVFLPPKQSASGILEYYNSSHNIAIVSVEKNFYDICPEDIFQKVRKSSEEVVALGREPEEGLLMGSLGKVKSANADRELDCRSLKLSTCKIKKVGIGGPLIDLGGNLIGMNFYDGRNETPFLPRSKIIKVLKRKLGLPLPSERGLIRPVDIKVKGRCKNNSWPVPEPYWRCITLECEEWSFPKLRGRTLQ